MLNLQFTRNLSASVRRLHHVANVLVISDPANPANEGKVFLYDFGKKIMDKIMDIMQPQFPGEEPVNPFDFWSGADFEMKIRNVAGYRNYDSSEFASQSPLLDDDDAMESIWKKQSSLEEFSAASQFKTYDELKTRLEYVLGKRGATPVAQDPEVQEEEYEVETPAPRETVSSVARSSNEIEDDDTLSYFQKLADD